MATDSAPVQVTITQPANGADGLNPLNVVVSGTNNIDYAVGRKAVARDVFGREFPGTIRQRPDSPAWSAVFPELPTDKWLVVYVEFLKPGFDDIGAGVISIRCRDKSSVSSPSRPAVKPARPAGRAKSRPTKPSRGKAKKSKGKK